MSIELRNIGKAFGNFVALDDVSLTVATGELVALLGLSGSGKTTLLRIIAGLETPDHGEVLFDGKSAAEHGVRERKVGFVFQHYALFRHMTVFENVAFGLRVKPRAERPGEEEIACRVHELLKLVQLDFIADRFPSQLSGGQRQRVALARTLAVEPKVLLLDEPFGSLDAKVRAELRRWLRRLHDEIGITSVFVTHDQEEALELADRVAVMNAGKIEQIGTAEEVYHRPANAFVHGFLGNVNLFHLRIDNGKVFLGDTAVEVDTAHGHATDGRKAVLAVRPHLLEIITESTGAKSFPAIVKSINPAGPQVKVELIAQSGDLVQSDVGHERFKSLHLQIGARVYLRPREQKLFIYQI
ncbi:MAG TPA: sulfate ABC transporter ATP-binding protein [Candidatus Binataceae bacterium]|nr:sulfate ABC transporter ATP-binding protein [Candidatus Binataceae bacterium]